MACIFFFIASNFIYKRLFFSFFRGGRVNIHSSYVFDSLQTIHRNVETIYGDLIHLFVTKHGCY